MFNSLYTILSQNAENKLFAICIDSFRFENSEKALIETNIPYRRIEAYRSRNAVDILKLEHANIVITGNDSPPIEKSFILAANHLNIPTLLIQDGLLLDAAFTGHGQLRILRHLKEPFKWARMYAFFFITLVSISSEPFRALLALGNDLVRRSVYTHNYGASGCSKIAVTGEYVKNVLIKQGVPNNRLVLTGQPRFDRLVNETFDTNLFRLILKIPKDKKIVTLCTQPFVEYKMWTPETRKQFLSFVYKSIKELPNYQFVIKLHPIDIFEDYKKVLSDIDANHKILLYKEIDLYRLISISDIVMTVNSTVALEAMIINKPVIIIDFYNQSSDMPYVTSGAVSVVCSPKSLTDQIKRLSDEKERNIALKLQDAFIYEHAYKTDGRASQRVVDLIVQMVANNNS